MENIGIEVFAGAMNAEQRNIALDDARDRLARMYATAAALELQDIFPKATMVHFGDCGMAGRVMLEICTVRYVIRPDVPVDVDEHEQRERIVAATQKLNMASMLAPLTILGDEGWFDLATAGPATIDPVGRAARRLREFVAYLIEVMDEDGGPTAGDPSDEAYERVVRNSLGGVFGDYAATFNPAVADAITELLSAIAFTEDITVIREKATYLADDLLGAIKRGSF